MRSRTIQMMSALALIATLSPRPAGTAAGCRACRSPPTAAAIPATAITETPSPLREGDDGFESG
jgi:hypothetical protein